MFFDQFDINVHCGTLARRHTAAGVARLSGQAGRQLPSRVQSLRH